MFTKLNLDKLHQSRQGLWFAIDLLMLVLLVINLSWLIFDSLYAMTDFSDLLHRVAPALAVWYAPIHQHFYFYDLLFVLLFLSEFLLRWVHAAVARDYGRWYFYPFIHWYDLIGCIPAGGYRLLRVLRIFSIVYRLQKYQIIDLSKGRVFQFVLFYYDALMEEQSDRVVIKVLSGMQTELESGAPIVHQIQQSILLPRQQLLINWLSDKVAQASSLAYLPQQEPMRDYISDIVAQALTQNREMQGLKKLPVVGTAIAQALDRAVPDIVFQVLDRLLQNLSSPENHRFIEDLVEVMLTDQTNLKTSLDQEVIKAMVELLELIKQQVKIKRWHQNLGSRKT